jgi:isoquinoline 1-oxidoreductase beta subunit
MRHPNPDTSSPEPVASASSTRRTVLQVGVAAGGGLLVGFGAEARPTARVRGRPFAPNAFIRIDGSGGVTLIMPQVEMGQGVYTSISMILAEELDADWASVSLEHAPPNEALYANPFLHVQATGNSNSIRSFWTPLRKAGAATRAMLMQAAATTWDVALHTVATQAGEVVHPATGRRLGYGALVRQAAALTPPRDPPLKPVSAFRLIGRPLPRLDSRAKVDGTAIYGIDVRLPGLRYATLAQSPVFGGRVAHVDDARARQMPGVRQVVVLEDLVAVVGDHMWAATQGLAALDIAWDEGANGAITTAQVHDQLRAASERPGVVARSVGDAERLLGKDALSLTYDVPFLAHAPMEP